MKVGIKDNNLVIIDTRPFTNPDPIKIPIEIIKQIIRKNEKKNKNK